MNQRGVSLLKTFEGFEGMPYKDAVGKLTIGYGMLLPLTEQEASLLLLERVKPYEEAVKTLVRVPLNENQLAALTSFTYNVGIGNFKKSTLIRLLNDGEYESVPKQLARWNKAGGRVLNGLIKRRAQEAFLWNTSI